MISITLFHYIMCPLRFILRQFVSNWLAVVYFRKKSVGSAYPRSKICFQSGTVTPNLNFNHCMR